MSFKFEKLQILQKAMSFGEDIYKPSLQFPKIEIYNLSSQIIRASDSIALNISEGSIMQSNPEYNRFLNYSVRSLTEVVTCLYKAKYRGYIDDQLFEKHYNEAYYLMNMIIAFKAKLKN
ncbi:four helix bundle protein [Paenimyroides viscosum]|uniref:Four helix bundle protein n=2 Tax=Paenimyroides viscosum TaxID=2488729 RepID=A0A3P1B0S6_9FLAO|nr:four helix bundle protein [Paenimyroides viscosum]